MFGEYKVNRCSRQCHALGRRLRDGEWYYSVVLESGDQLIRQDYSAEAWSGPPQGTIGWWKNRMPTADEKKMILAPPEVLIDLLRQLGDVPEKAKSRYLLALMLLRRRIVKPAAPGGDGTVDDKTLRLEVPGKEKDDESLIEVTVCPIARSEADRLKDELNDLVYCEAEPG